MALYGFNAQISGANLREFSVQAKAASRVRLKKIEN